MIRIGIVGACGRMGKKIASIALEDKDVDIKAAIEKKGFIDGGQDLGKILDIEELGVMVSEDLCSACNDIDCLIDFTLPEPTMEHLKICAENNVSMVIGTTGLTPDQEELIRKAADSISIVFSPNMAIGVNVLFKIVKEAAKALAGDFSIKVDETHHVHKKDSPSGTAKMIGKVIKEGAQVNATIEVFREGEVVGNHGIIFESEFETLEIRHDAKSRDVFAAGAVKAAKFLKDKKPGLYTMADVLGLK